MTKTKRRTLLIIGAALLLAAAAVLCVFLLRPKTTIASLMELDSPDQIVKIELAEFRFGPPLCLFSGRILRTLKSGSGIERRSSQ